MCIRVCTHRWISRCKGRKASGPADTFAYSTIFSWGSQCVSPCSDYPPGQNVQREARVLRASLAHSHDGGCAAAAFPLPKTFRGESPPEFPCGGSPPPIETTVVLIGWWRNLCQARGWGHITKASSVPPLCVTCSIQVPLRWTGPTCSRLGPVQKGWLTAVVGRQVRCGRSHADGNERIS